MSNEYRITLKSIKAAAAKRPPGYEAALRAAGVIHVDKVEGEVLSITETALNEISARYSNSISLTQSAPVTTSGVGTELKKLLHRFGITASGKCACEQRATEMDAKGIDWCEANKKLIEGWLREEARARRLPFNTLAARALLRLAIRNARATVTPPPRA